MPAALLSREEAIDRLLTAFRKDGFAGASVSRLEQSTGLKRASLYHHFPGGKADMARAVLQAANERFDEQVLAPLRSDAPPVARLRASADGLARFYDGGRLACLLELFSLGDGPVGAEIETSFAAWIAALAEALKASGMAEREAEARASDLVARVQGALILARGMGEVAPFRRATEAIARAADRR